MKDREGDQPEESKTSKTSKKSKKKRDFSTGMRYKRDVKSDWQTHNISIFQKIPDEDEENTDRRKYKKDWFAKLISLDLAIKETIAGELMRYLTRNNTPKVRMIYGKSAYSSGARSEGVEGYYNFSNRDITDLLRENNFRGLASTLISMILLGESDANLHNLYINALGVVGNIDSDRKFRNREPVTSENLGGFPRPSDSGARWLIMSDVAPGNAHLDGLEAEASQNKYFDDERNKTLLLILLTPDDFFRKFFDEIIDYDKLSELLGEDISQYHDELSKYFFNKLEEVRKAARNLPSFQRFIQNEAELKKATEEIHEYMSEFRFEGETALSKAKAKQKSVLPQEFSSHTDEIIEMGRNARKAAGYHAILLGNLHAFIHTEAAQLKSGPVKSGLTVLFSAVQYADKHFADYSVEQQKTVLQHLFEHLDIIMSNKSHSMWLYNKSESLEARWLKFKAGNAGYIKASGLDIDISSPLVKVRKMQVKDYNRYLQTVRLDLRQPLPSPGSDKPVPQRKKPT